MRRRRALAVAVLMLAASWTSAGGSTAALADEAAVRCACCADPGRWSQESRRVTPEELSEIGRVRPAGAARLFVTAAGLEAVLGVQAPSPTYTVSREGDRRQWVLQIATPAGHAGSVSFEIPDRAEFYAADLDPVSLSRPEVVLYKEWRFSGVATGSGDFRGGSYRLVLQGRGNACPSADDFTAWRLELTGRDVRYALYGALGPAAPRPVAR